MAKLYLANEGGEKLEYYLFDTESGCVIGDPLRHRHPHTRGLLEASATVDPADRIAMYIGVDGDNVIQQRDVKICKKNNPKVRHWRTRFNLRSHLVAECEAGRLIADRKLEACRLLRYRDLSNDAMHDFLGKCSYFLINDQGGGNWADGEIIEN